MKPEFPSPEINSNLFQSSEKMARDYSAELRNTEALAETYESYEQKSELGAAAGDFDATSVFPAPITSAIGDNTQPIVAPSTNSNPLVAGNADRIEQVWVDKAKKILADYKDDPYIQDEKIVELKDKYKDVRYRKGQMAA